MAKGDSTAAPEVKTPEQEELEEFFKNQQPTVRVYLRRVDPDGKFAALGPVDLSVLDNDPEGYLAQRFGPGEYSCLFDSKPKSRTIRYRIDPSHVGVTLWRKAQETPDVSRGTLSGDLNAELARTAIDLVRSSQEKSGGGETVTMLLAMMDRNAAADREARADARAAAERQAAEDREARAEARAQADRQSTAMMTMMTAVMTNKTDPLEMATKLAALTRGGGDANPLAQVKELLSITNELRDASGDRGDPEPEGFGSIVRSIPWGKIVDAVATERQHLPTPAPPHAVVDIDQAAGAALRASPTDTDEEHEMPPQEIEAQLRQVVGILLESAKRGADPMLEGAKVYGKLEMAVTFKQISRAQFTAAIQYLAKGTDDNDPESPFELDGERIAALMPEAAPFVDWLDAALTGIRASTTPPIIDPADLEDDEEDDDEPPTPIASAPSAAPAKPEGAT